MKITKTQLKRIIKEELEIFEAKYVIYDQPANDPARHHSVHRDPVSGAAYKKRIKQDYADIPEMTKPEFKKLYEDPGSTHGIPLDTKYTQWKGEGAPDPLAILLMQSMNRVAEVYEDKAYVGRTKDDFPPAIGKMATLVAAQDYHIIREQYNNLLIDLFAWHKDPYYPARLPIPRRVVHNMSSIGTIVRNAE